MKYAELKADNERLRTQLADLVNAVAALRVEMEQASTAFDSTFRTELKCWADKLAAILDSRKDR